MKTQADILSFLAEGLKAASDQHTILNLGDRSQYLGVSDLALGLTCPRAVVAAKLAGEQAAPSLETLLKLRRGHWLEYGFEEALVAVRRKYIPQLRVSLRHENVTIKGHLDFVIPDEDGKGLTVLELKSTAKLPEAVYPNHEAQLYGQLGLLSRLWSQPVFSVGDYSASYSFPELAERHLGIKLPKSADTASIRGFVLAVSPQAAKAFGPYEPNDAVLAAMLRSGTAIWQQLTAIRTGQAALEDVPYCAGFQPTCAYCRHNRRCPKFQGDSHPELERELAALADLKAHRSDVEAEIKEREDQLKALAALMGRPGQWINSGTHRFRVSSQAGKVTLDQNLLKAGLGQAGGMDEQELSALLATAQKVGRPFERLQISPIN
jgi:hypothetical protein